MIMMIDGPDVGNGGNDNDDGTNDYDSDNDDLLMVMVVLMGWIGAIALVTLACL